MFVINTPANAMTDTLSGENVDLTLDVVADLDVEVLADVNANVWVVMMTMLPP